MRRLFQYMIMLSLISVWVTILPAQNFTNGFNFNLPAQDTTSQRFLPQFPIKPIGGNDFVSIDSDGHFSVAGRPIRFWGTNAVADGAFPTKTKAGFIAGRLRKMGFNLVRFHHIDNPWSHGSLFVQGQDTRHFNSATLDRLDKFIAELKKNSAYANMNLHVSRTFNEKDGVADADSIPNYGKGVTIFDPQLIQLQKEYARQLLTHINPYTGLALVNDPAMAMVEIINENSLYRMWRDDKLKPLAQGGDLIMRHHQLLNDLWQDCLIRKYGTTDSLRHAWNEGVRTAGTDDQVYDGGFEADPLLRKWQLELHSPAQGAMGIEVTNPYRGNFSGRVIVSQTDGVNWHVQWKQSDLTIQKDSLYTVSFAGRSDANRMITVSVMKNSSPWTTFFSSSFLLTPAWKKFEFSFRAPESCAKDTRLSFHLGSEKGTYWFDEIHFVSSALKGLAEEESLESRTVRRIDFSECAAYSDLRVMDMSAFYLQLQNDFFAEMMNYLKNDLGVKVPIVGTNWNVGPADLAVQSQLDYIDNHSYWDHPQFPGEPWDSSNWLIENAPMVRSTSGGTIPALMGGVGFQGKPFTVSEYNHAFPNRYQSEGVLFLSAYASFHDVDGIMFFDYCGSSDDWETDKVDGYFSIHRNTAMMALMPSCARAYRDGYISSAQQTVLLNYSQDQILLLPKNDTRNWQGPETFPRTLALQHAVRNASFNSSLPLEPSGLPPAPMSPYTSDTGEITWDTNGLMKVATPYFSGVTGFLNQFHNHQIGDLTLVAASGFGTLSWVTATSESLQLSDRSLITLSSKLQNAGMVWDGTRTVHNNWGNPPTQMEPIYVKLRLKIQADSIRVYPLNAMGAEGTSFYNYLPISENIFEISLNQNQDKTVWFGVESFGGRSTIKPDEPVPDRFRLDQNYPNPFDNSGQSGSQTKIKYFLPGNGKIRLTIYDLLGRTVRILVDQNQFAGDYGFDWDGRDGNGNRVEAGIYFYRMEVGLPDKKIDVTKKMIVLR